MERVLPAQHQAERALTETGSGAVQVMSRRRVEHPRARFEHDRGHIHVIGAELFRGALIRERKVADRTNQRFGVLLVGMEERSATAASVWDAAIEAVGAAKRDTDVFGWFEQGATLGIILPDVGGPDAPVALEIESRVLRELQNRLEPIVVSRFAVKLHLHHDVQQRSSVPEVHSVEPLISRLRPQNRTAPYDRFKRAMDLAASLALLTLLSPLFVLVAAVVKLTSRGPVFFRQERIGQHARPFGMLKFRTMRANNDPAVHQQYVTEFISGAGTQAAKPGVFKIANDTRITPVGRLLRRTSIDELPQLWNVVRGEMSLVGPRPPLPYEVAQYKAWHRRRVLEAKPGMTGLWQVAGRSRTTFDEMVRLDLRYARSCSFWTDLKILLATPGAVIGGKGAC
jgi:lipopolysaccharide/colanic/teichoic acid biosynthesis glycosyltransferase